MKRRNFDIKMGEPAHKLARYSDQNETHHHRILIDDRHTAVGFINDDDVGTQSRNLDRCLEIP